MSGRRTHSLTGGIVAAIVAVTAVLLTPESAAATTWRTRDLNALSYETLAEFQHDNGLVAGGEYGERSELALSAKVEEVQRTVGVTADGRYGADTRSAVADWQRSHDMKATGTADSSTMKAMRIARTVWISARWNIAEHGWNVPQQFPCLRELWNNESNWRVYATNPSSGAYGIPQALPGDKMATAGEDWRQNPETQITWGTNYIENRYGTPCEAWHFWQGNGWYGIPA